MNPVELIRRYRVLLALLASVIVLVAAWYTGQNPPQSGTGATNNSAFPTLSSVLAGLGTSLIAFIIVSWLFSKEDKFIEEKDRTEKNQSLINQTLESSTDAFDKKIRNAVTESVGTAGILQDVKWGQLINNSAEIDFVVQGWDGWFERPEVAEALTDFFDRGGKFRLYLYDSDSLESLRVREDMGKRINRSPDSVDVEIEETCANLREAKEKSARGSIEIYRTNQTIWYFGALFSGRQYSERDNARDVMVFSIYSHTKRKPWFMPAIQIYPDIQQDQFRDWFASELAYMKNDDDQQRELPLGLPPSKRSLKVE